LSTSEVFHLNYAWVNPEIKIIKEVKSKVQYANKKLISGNILSCNGVFIKKEVAYQHTFNENRDFMLPIITSYIVNHKERSVNSI
jgi:hypothetical protein